MQGSTQYEFELTGGGVAKPSSLGRVWVLAFVSSSPVDVPRWLRRSPALLCSRTGTRLVEAQDAAVVFDAVANTFHTVLPAHVGEIDVEDLTDSILHALRNSRHEADDATEMVGVSFRGGRRSCRGGHGSKRLLQMLSLISRTRGDNGEIEGLCRHALASFPESDDVVKGMLLRTMADALYANDLERGLASYSRALAAFKRAGRHTPLDASSKAAGHLRRHRQASLALDESEIGSRTASPNGLGYDGYLLTGMPLTVEVPFAPSMNRGRGRVIVSAMDPVHHSGLLEVRRPAPNHLAASATPIESPGRFAVEGRLDHELALLLGTPVESAPTRPWPMRVWCETRDFDHRVEPVLTHVGGSAVFELAPKGAGSHHVRIYFMPEGLDPCYAECTVEVQQS